MDYGHRSSQEPKHAPSVNVTAGVAAAVAAVAVVDAEKPPARRAVPDDPRPAVKRQLQDGIVACLGERLRKKLAVVAAVLAPNETPHRRSGG